MNLTYLSFLSLILIPTLALAQAPSTSVIPYSGTLFSQGKPVSQSAPVQMAFALYTDTTGLDAGQTDEAPAANRMWSSWGAGDVVGSDQTIPVQVRNGRFLVHLGEDGQTALADSVFDQRPLSVVAWVVNESGEFRLPAQVLEKVPHAVTAERANSFEVMGDLTVAGNTTTDSLTVNGSAVVDGLNVKTSINSLQTSINSINNSITQILKFRILAVLRVQGRVPIHKSPNVNYNSSTGEVTFSNPINCPWVPIVSHMHRLSYSTNLVYLRSIGPSNKFRVWRTPLDTGSRNDSPEDFTAIVVCWTS